MWDNNLDDCDVCQCSRMIKGGFKLSRQTCDTFHDDGAFDNDKENMPQGDISLYENSSPVPTACDGNTSPMHCSHSAKRRPLEDHDPNSRDSGYGTSFGAEPSKFFQQSSFDSGSLCSMDDAFLDFSDICTPLEGNNLPSDFNKLISRPINLDKSVSPKRCRPAYQRAVSCGQARSCLFKIQEDEVRPFKRSEAPGDLQSPSTVKRCKLFSDPADHFVIRRSLSTPSSEESIKFAVQRSVSEPDLIGDFTKTFCLPITPGRHQDLKSITPHTLAKLMEGSFTKSVASFKVIDCRYPYEFEGGHISGAVNVFTKEQCMKLLEEINVPVPDQKRRHILVFHCEFSSQRGPNLSRYLRRMDRNQNQSSYPALSYPEVYLLDGGYKNFYEQYSELCEPVAYKPMLHPDHKEDLRVFRAKCKSFDSDARQRPLQRSSLLKLNL